MIRGVFAEKLVAAEGMARSMARSSGHKGEGGVEVEDATVDVSEPTW